MLVSALSKALDYKNLYSKKGGKKKEGHREKGRAGESFGDRGMDNIGHGKRYLTGVRLWSSREESMKGCGPRCRNRKKGHGPERKKAV